MTIGILAYGSLLDDPGEALAHVTVQVLDVAATPFAVEFGRSSRSRDGAPTLTRVEDQGAPVPAGVFVLDPSLDLVGARTLLYRRESHRNTAVASGARPSWIHCLRGFAGVDVCLYAALARNIRSLEPKALAKLAVASAARTSGALRRDGISYLEAQLRRDVRTPLSRMYEDEILKLVGASDLSSAWCQVRTNPRRFLSV